MFSVGRRAAAPVAAPVAAVAVAVVAAGVVAAGVVAAGCTREPTQIVVTVYTDYEVPDELASVTLRACPAGAPCVEQLERAEVRTVALGVPDAPGAPVVATPFSFGVQPGAGGAEMRARIEVEALGARASCALTGEAEGCYLQTSTAQVGFADEASLALPLYLARACRGDPCARPGAELTCGRDAQCVEVNVPASALAPAVAGDPAPDADAVDWPQTCAPSPACATADDPARCEACNGLDDDCDGAIDGAASAWACTAGAGAEEAACVGGRCAAVACEAGRADCDASAENDCETALGTTDDCASCGDRCGPGSTCVAGACRYLGSYLWSATHAAHTSATVQTTYGVATSADGGVVVTGGFRGAVDFGGGVRTASGTEELYVAAFGPDGSYRWDAVSAGATATATAHGTDVAIDGEGRVRVVGRFLERVSFGGTLRTTGTGGTGGSDLAVLTLDADGTFLRDTTFRGAGSTGFGPYVEVQNDGTTFIAGCVEGPSDLGTGVRPAAGSDVYVLALDEDGEHLWDRQFGAPEVWARTRALALDASGRVIVGGTVNGTLDFGGGSTARGQQTAFVVALEADGSHAWDRAYGGSGDPSYVNLYGLAARERGGVFATGSFAADVEFGDGLETTSAPATGFVLALNAAGALEWTHVFGARESGDYVFALAVAEGLGGGPLVTGWWVGRLDVDGVRRTSVGANDTFLLALDGDGALLWDRELGASGATTFGDGLVTDGLGRLFLRGMYHGTVDFGAGARTGGGGSAADFDTFVVALRE